MSNFEGTPPFYNRIRGCHGNHTFSHSLDRFIFIGTLFRIQEILMNNLALMKKCPAVARKA